MDLDGSIFWYLGGALVLAALAISFIGIRGKDSFPPSRRAMGVGLAVFALLVVTTVAYAVANASEEKEHRDAEIAEAEAEAGEEEVEAGDTVTTNPGGQPEGTPPQEPGAAPGGEKAPSETGDDESPVGGAAQSLDVTSPSDGSLAFEPEGLQANAGLVSLAYSNPSPVPHSIAIEDEQGETLDESDTVVNGDTEASDTLTPGEYIYYCTVPGHREGGMEGVLTVE